MEEEIEKAEEYFAQGDKTGVLRIADAGFAETTAGINWVRFALKCRDNGAPDLAEQILQVVIQKRPDESAAYHELAFIFRLRGQHRNAATLLQESLVRAGPNFRSQLFLAHMLYALGAQYEGDCVLNAAIPRNVDEFKQLDVLFAFGQYIREHPLGRSLVMLDQMKAKFQWLETDALATRILEAIDKRRPFALVRFGDGEGGVLRLSAGDEFAYRPLYNENRQELIAMWFGHSFPWASNGFLEVATSLLDATAECDVVGVPYESWVRHEYEISSLRGIPSLVNIYRSFLDRPRESVSICSQLVHSELNSIGFLKDIIIKAGSLSVISCMEDLPAVLKSRFGLDDVKLYRIPGEQGSKHILGETATRGVHYPDAFLQLQAELSRDHNGRVFLVAGGLLGKFYAATIRKYGGIAIDIGSIADSWMGHATRPGYDLSSKL